MHNGHMRNIMWNSTVHYMLDTQTESESGGMESSHSAVVGSMRGVELGRWMTCVGYEASLVEAYMQVV